MHSQYFNLKQTNTQINKSRRSKFAAGAIMIVGTVASVALYQHLNDYTSVQMTLFGSSELNETQMAFLRFIAEHGKTYATKSHYHSKFETFAKNYQDIKEHNSVNEHFKKEINKFADMTVDEFNEEYHKFGLKLPDLETRNKHSRPHLQAAPSDKEETLADKVDWREANKVSDSIDQASCGSCWAFTTATTMESLHAIKNGTGPNKFSVQYLIDCDSGNYGCGGGWMLDAYTWVKKNGIVKESDYPRHYQRSKGACADTKDKEKFYNHDQNEEDNVTNDRLKKLISERPVGVAMHSNPSCLMAYKSGILRDQDCKCSDEKKQVNHAVAIVGYGTAENNSDCVGYWLIKNSWGTKWGDGGFFKLCIPHEEEDKNLKTGTCQIKSYVQYPILNE
ncbi:gut cathepsin l-like cysteine protease [Stylonychia lemnae]|uniref:Gut cathepsin l-like cysteine protease n=1 Tax=Stylonychia lemnae TaxID=5949 RepID=A0A078A4G4_STYLE|nr:gut cathepsin l-like cysteine protease [Stylonychia lemnae]|eukprot:CDW75654.1 gut cathepsin l-like cysteine protease [Stylonychia lemnae]